MIRQRTKMLASSLKRELAQLLLLESRNPLFQKLVITRVEISNDLQIATIYYTNYINGNTDSEKTDAQLKRAIPFFFRKLRSRFTMKHFPDLRFKYDTELEQMEKIENILKEIKEK